MGGRIILAILFTAGAAYTQADVAEISSVKVAAGGDRRKVYFRIGPKPKAKQPKRGYGLVILMPGGDGGEGFHAWCKRIYKHALDDSYVAAQPVAIKWTPNQRIVWPTEKNRVEKQGFSSEEFVEAVVADARKWRKIDPNRIFLLAWSSSGPAAYALSLAKKKSPTGFFVAMSVFKPKELPGLGGAKGEAYFLYHSPGDNVCPFRMAKDAERRLGKNGAEVKLVSYRGNHGWGHANVFGNLRAGFLWLERHHAKPAKPARKGR